MEEAAPETEQRDDNIYRPPAMTPHTSSAPRSATKRPLRSANIERDETFLVTQDIFLPDVESYDGQGCSFQTTVFLQLASPLGNEVSSTIRVVRFRKERYAARGLHRTPGTKIVHDQKQLPRVPKN